MHRHPWGRGWIGALMLAAAHQVAVPASAVEASSPEAAEVADVQWFEELLVVGSDSGLQELPGSGHRIDAEEIARQGYQDVGRILQQVPGITVQEEDGFGLRPNIGIRGTGVERSSKVTLLEDGVLIAPAPYAAPSAYYSPTAGRMGGFEIVKGAGAIRQGPHTNGGSINYLSSPIPTAEEVVLELAGGSDGYQRLHARAGGAGDRYGWMLQALDLGHDGFKQLDGGGPTGFALGDYLGKFRIHSRPEAGRFQALELKLGHTEQAGDETYVGLTADDFVRNPFRRYAGSAGDTIDTEHEQIQLSYEVKPGARSRFTVTAYRNDFFRNWAKLEKVDGVGVASVLADPAAHPDALAHLRGDSDSEVGALSVRNNRRDYFSTGVQAVFGIDRSSGSIGHEFEFGLRVHEDEEDRFQEEDRYQMLGGRRTFNALGLPGSHANRVASARATAAFVRDTIRVGAWTFTPGVRVESIDLKRLDFGREDSTRTGASLSARANALSEVIPGLGVSYALSESRQLFVGLHRGFSPPGPSSTEEVGAEESFNVEAGYRFSSGTRRAELTAFYSDYDNLLGTDTASGGGSGSGDQFNGGAATVLGVEAGLGLQRTIGRRILPLDLTYTYTAGEFDSSFESNFADWAPFVTAGDALPYLAEHRLHASAGLESERFGLFIDADYVSDMRTRAGSGPIPAAETIGARTLVDVRVETTFAERWNVFAQLLNATDEIYLAARRPAGLRPGMPRSVIVGFRVDFGD